MEKNARMLIVDDLLINLEILEYIFNNEFEIRSAASGKEAVELISASTPAFQPDIILMDVMMPEMDGYEACRRIREMPNLKGLKIIMVTAKALPEERQKGFDAGADDYVTKPYDHEDLKSRVNALLGLPNSRE